MPRIVNNRICYIDHNVVLDPELYKGDRAGEMDYLLMMAEALTPDGDARLHNAQLNSFNNDGTWTIELPTITTQYVGERPGDNSTAVSVTLNNGNVDKLIAMCTVDNIDGVEAIARRYGVALKDVRS